MRVPGGSAGKAAALCGAAVVAYFCALVTLGLTSLELRAHASHAILLGLITVGPILTLASSVSVWRWAHLVASDLAYRDELTGLQNRRAFMDAGPLLLKGLRPGKIALVLFDVDGLKQLNDGCGHQAGDELLRFAARAIKSAATQGSMTYRIGGDEFAMLLMRDKGAQLAATLRSIEPFEVEFGACAHRHIVRMSLGYASCEEGDSFDSLFRRADLRLRESKDRLYGLQRAPVSSGLGGPLRADATTRSRHGLTIVRSGRG